MTLEMTVAEVDRLELRASAWRRVGPECAEAYAVATGGEAAAHCEPLLLVALMPTMLKDLMAVTDRGRGTNYGLDGLVVMGEAPIGCEARLRASLPAASRRPNGGVAYRIAFEVEVRGQRGPVLGGEATFLTYPRAG